MLWSYAIKKSSLVSPKFCKRILLCTMKRILLCTITLYNVTLFLSLTCAFSSSQCLFCLAYSCNRCYCLCFCCHDYYCGLSKHMHGILPYHHCFIEASKKQVLLPLCEHICNMWVDPKALFYFNYSKNNSLSRLEKVAHPKNISYVSLLTQYFS